MTNKRQEDAELEKAADIRRTELPTPSSDMIRSLEKAILGRSWGKPRRKMKGWPPPHERS